ncbi:T9SS type A sorting domain-containing protein [Roseivirga sp. UBA1976]|nr:T9SS type A sorting domain-containing protein [Roseivirga sp. UBA1976]
MTATEWALLYATMMSQEIKSTAYTFPSTSAVKGSIESYNSTDVGKTNITTLFYEYNKIKSNALSSNLLYISNNKLYDVSGRPSSPYNLDKTFAAAPTKNELTGSIQTFKLRNALYYSNSTKTVTARQVDLDDGLGYRTVAWNGEITANYTTDGEKTIKLKFTFSDSSVADSHFKIYVSETSSTPYSTIYPAGSIFHQNFPHTGGAYTPSTYLGAYATGRVTVDLAAGNTGIKKPLIIVEGFDPTNTFNFTDILTDQVGGLGIAFNSTTLFHELHYVEGYDIVFLNFNNSTTYIQRNAYLLQEVIKWVNAEKVVNNSTAKNKVMGISMGGLVARYALSDMEDRNINHGTDLYISMDTPHQGANVPVGLQAAFRHLTNLSFNVGILGVTPKTINIRDIVDVSIAEGIFNSQAAKQMLKNYVSGTSSLSISSADHNSFIQDLKNQGMSGANGYPSRWGIQNVAISNGNECGGDIGFSAGDQLMNFNNSDLGMAGPFINYLLSYASLNKSSRYVSLTDWLALGRELKFNFLAKAIPNQQVSQVYSGNIKIKKKILGIINQTTTLTSVSLNSLSSMLPTDNPGAGVYSLATFGGNNIPQDILNFMDQDKFSFIPTVSSLDIGGGNVTLNSNDLYSAYNPASPPSSPKNSPFDYYVTGFQNNETHTQFTYRNANFLLDALNGGSLTAECLNLCYVSSSTIGGSSKACTTASTYSTISPPSGSTVSWSVESGLQIVSSSGNTASIKSTLSEFDSGGFRTITATFSTACGDVSITKNVWAGPPSIYTLNPDGTKNYFGGSYSYPASPSTQTITVFSDAPNVTYSWDIFPTNIQWAGNGNQATFYTTNEGNYTLTVTADNGCYSFSQFYVINIGDGGGGFGGLSLMVYPNPSSDEMEVEVSDLDKDDQVKVISKTSNIEEKEEFFYQLINHHQEIVFSKKVKNRNIKIPAKQFRKGQYILRVSSRGKSVSKHVIIN